MYFRMYSHVHLASSEKLDLELLTFLDKKNFHTYVAIMLLSSIVLMHISFYLTILGIY